MALSETENVQIRGVFLAVNGKIKHSKPGPEAGLARDLRALLVAKEVSPEHPGAIMRNGKVDNRSFGNDPGRIYPIMAGIVVTLDLKQIDRIADPRHLIKVAQIAPQVRIVHNPP